jgi:two-component system phosphate regulon sensor histidine kinase PhoR
MNIKVRFLILYFCLGSLVLAIFFLGERVPTRTFEINWFIAVLALVLPGIWAYFAVASYYNRLERVRQSARSLARGDYDNVVYPDAADELGMIASELYLLKREIESNIQNATQEGRKMEAIIKSMREGVIVLDHVGRIVLFNRAAEEIFDCSQEDMRLKYLLQEIRNQDLARIVNNALNGGESGSLELQMGNKCVQMQVSPIGNRTDGAVIVCHDVTELRRLEQVRTEFVANVSHELRTPLTSIKGFIETLMDGAVEEPEVRDRFLSIIQSETLRLHRLIDDLLELSRLEAKKQLHADDLSLYRGYVQEAYARIDPVIRGYAEAKALAFDVQLAADLPAVALGEDLLSQLLLNLLENAVKYTQKGKVWLRAAYDEQQVHLEFGDTGCGIPEDSLPRIFERFYRVDRARSRGQGGTGLGLSIVKHIVEGCGGRIQVKSQIAAGTVFTCDIPRFFAANAKEMQVLSS